MALGKNTTTILQKGLTTIFGHEPVVGQKQADGSSHSVGINVNNIDSISLKELADLQAGTGTQASLKRSGTGIRITFQ
jgi:hypothetical protein